ncbi:MAG: ROK family protein [Bacteroidetes bacterium]|nr:ROK family protein [Bacteroidota bacterium]HET6244499.1 ROK family protein [Bacteroidia bacterium]
MQEISVVAGIDVGGFTTEIGLVDAFGTCFEKCILTTSEFTEVNEFVKQCLKAINQLKNESRENLAIKAIGIGAPNANFYRGTIEYPVNLSWKGIIPFVKLFNQNTELPVALTNDANAAAIGEKLFGGAKKMDNFLSLTLGTGLGSGIYTNGKIVHGHQGFAGEMGHIIMHENGRMCGSGIRGCLEAYVSAEGIKRTIYYMLSDSKQNSEFRDITFNNLTGEQITQAAENGDTIAIKAFEYTAAILGKKLADIVSILDPEAIFFGGGLARAGDLLLAPAKIAMEENLLPVFKNKIKLQISELLDKNSAILGASALGWDLVINKKKIKPIL